MLTRRSLLRAIPVLLAAPAIVRASSLMPVRALIPNDSATIFAGVQWGYPSFVDVERFIADEVLPLAQRQLVAFQGMKFITAA